MTVAAQQKQTPSPAEQKSQGHAENEVSDLAVHHEPHCESLTAAESGEGAGLHNVQYIDACDDSIDQGSDLDPENMASGHPEIQDSGTSHTHTQALVQAPAPAQPEAVPTQAAEVASVPASVQPDACLDDMLLAYMVSAAAEAAQGQPHTSAAWSRIARQLGWHHKRYTVGDVLTVEQAAALKLSHSQRVSLRVRNPPRAQRPPRSPPHLTYAETCPRSPHTTTNGRYQ